MTTAPAEREDRTMQERRRPHRAGLRSPLPLSPEEEIRDRSGVRFATGRSYASADRAEAASLLRSPELGPESLRGNDDDDRDYAVTERPGAVAQGRRAVTYSAKGESHHTGGEREQSAKEEDGPG